MKVRKYADESTTEEYKFLIYCEHCGKQVLEYADSPEVSYKPKLFMDASKRRAKELLWLTGHKKAFEEASDKALQKLNRCEVCGRLVCNDCYVFSDELDGNVCCKECMSQIAAQKTD